MMKLTWKIIRSETAIQAYDCKSDVSILRRLLDLDGVDVSRPVHV